MFIEVTNLKWIPVGGVAGLQLNEDCNYPGFYTFFLQLKVGNYSAFDGLPLYKGCIGAVTRLYLFTNFFYFSLKLKVVATLPSTGSL